MNTLTLNTDDRKVYAFATMDADIEATDDGIVIGYPVTVSYYGQLDDNLPEQTVSLVDVKVGSFKGLSPEEKARHILLTLSLEEEIGQMFIVRCPESGAADIQAQYQFGGYILFGRDFADKTVYGAAADISSYQSASRLPMLIAVDEEGGTVNRVSRYKQYRFAPFASPQELYALGGLSAVSGDAKGNCTLLSVLGINMNFAPVCDVSTDPADYIYARSFGQNADLTSEYVKTVVESMSGTGVGPVLKHFPGYGNNKDTHTGSAIDIRPLEAFTAGDFLPFEAGIKAGAGVVLVCHNMVRCMDDARPASLSPEVHRILRQELGFAGVIITDDLSMAAITDFAGDKSAAVLAVLAGNDLLCCTDYAAQYAAVLEAAQSGDIPRTQIDASVSRILCYKISLGIL
ncbi:Beta-hexosaminidase [bioreactor metagenome]|uniref:beta-N-acetylhexosaminidase n=1 Tax=bioreactor metagenome TaxID=1076179 RepID=A0A644Y5R5_9ZZZZ